MDVYNELQKPTVTSSQRKFHKYFTETSSLPRHFTHMSIGVPVSVCFHPPKTNMTGWKIHHLKLKMYFLLKTGDFPVSHVSFQGVVRGIFLHCPGGTFPPSRTWARGMAWVITCHQHLGPEIFWGASKGGKDGKDGDTLLKFTPWKINGWFTYKSSPIFFKGK